MNKLIGLILLGFLSSCTTMVKMPAQVVNQKQAEESWKFVLTNYVDQDGWVDFEAILKNPEPLNQYVAFIKDHSPKNSPEMFKTASDQLAFYINSYNALSMYNVLDSGVPETNSGLKKVKFFVFKKMPIGKEVMSLKTYEDGTIRTLDEPRIHFALNCMAVSCPKLPQVPFEGSMLDAQLEAGAKFFFSEKRNLVIDHEKKTAYTTEILDFFPKDFLVKAPSLIAFINKYAVEKIPDGYKLKFFDYNWTIINQSRKSIILKK